MISFEWERLAEVAATRSGVDPSGVAELGEGFTVLCSDLMAAELSPAGARLMQADLIRIVGQRLRWSALSLEASRQVRTATADPSWVAIVGLPRTGSTLLHNLLTAQASAGFVPLWRALYPSSVSTTEAAEAKLNTDKQLRLMDRLSPNLRIAHPMEPDWPEEDITLQTLTGASERFVICGPFEEYAHWYYEQDLSRSYRMLADLVRGCIDEVDLAILKAPSHLPNLDLMTRFFPGIRFIWLHRDPGQVISSYTSLVSAVRGLFTSSVDRVSVTQEWEARLESHLLKALQVRDQLDILDLWFEDLVSRPLDILEAIYGWLGVSVSTTEAASWLELHGSAGSHHRYPSVHKHGGELLGSFDEYRELVRTIRSPH